MATLNINSDEIVKFTDKLEKIHRSAVPVAVRTSLNSVAFDVKKRTLQSVTKQKFVNRSANFFKAFSGVEKAKGWDIKQMKSKAGMIKKRDSSGKDSQAADNMVQQEIGGTIKSRTFVPIDSGRIGKSHQKRVKKNNRLNSISKIAPKVRKGDKSEMMKTANKVGAGGHMIYGKTLFRIQSLKKGKPKLLPLYSYRKGRTVKVKGTGFVRKSAMISAKRLESTYIREAKKRIARL